MVTGLFIVQSPGKLTWEHCCEVGSDQISRASPGEGIDSCMFINDCLTRIFISISTLS